MKLYAWKTDYLGKCIHNIPYYSFSANDINWSGMRKWDSLSEEEQEYVKTNPKHSHVDWYKFPGPNKCGGRCV